MNPSPSPSGLTGLDPGLALKNKTQAVTLQNTSRRLRCLLQVPLRTVHLTYVASGVMDFSSQTAVTESPLAVEEEEHSRGVAEENHSGTNWRGQLSQRR